jgi:hypothetical protein
VFLILLGKNKVFELGKLINGLKINPVLAFL